jgi:hypothetical protein
MAHEHRAPLVEELSLYELNRLEWLRSHAGEFVLIGDRRAAGFFPSYEAAFEAGLGAFGISKDFLIKQVVEHEPVFVIY